MNKRSVGSRWEQYASDYLRGKGYIILHMNYRTRYSEIDIVALDDKELVFVEVKYRADSSQGSPIEAVTPSKESRIRSAALSFLQEEGYNIDETPIRFDVIGIMNDELEHIEGAF